MSNEMGPPSPYRDEFENYFMNYTAGGLRPRIDAGATSPADVQGMPNIAAPGYSPQAQPSQPDIGALVGPADASKGFGDDGLDKSLGYGPDGSDGIGLMGTLGILNTGAGLGGQIFKMITARKPRPPRAPIPAGGGNMFR